MKPRYFYLTGISICVILTCVLYACQRHSPSDTPERLVSASVTQKWYRLTLELEQHTPGYRPPVSARTFAYIALAAYNAAQPCMPEMAAASSFLKGSPPVSLPDKNTPLLLPAALNAAYATIIKRTFATAPVPLLTRIDETENELQAFIENQFPQNYNSSAAFGASAANAVWNWSQTDTLGHDACMFNYDRDFVPNDCPGCWKPSTGNSKPALLPHWGEVRTFMIAPDEFSVKPPLPFDEKPGSAFYTEAMEVFTTSQHLSKENHWIAEFWSDDLPEFTVSPSGRWVSITWQAIEKARPEFSKIIEIYLKTGIALHDAGVLCWKEKYKYQLERPDTYIQRNISPVWEPLHPSPNFPAYPSGHAACGAAAATVLSDLLGADFAMTDRTHEGRTEFQGQPRSFASFEDMAHENALSRLALGVHFRMDCEEGLRLGRLAGHKINAVSLRKRETIRQ